MMRNGLQGPDLCECDRLTSGYKGKHWRLASGKFDRVGDVNVCVCWKEEREFRENQGILIYLSLTLSKPSVFIIQAYVKNTKFFITSNLDPPLF